MELTLGLICGSELSPRTIRVAPTPSGVVEFPHVAAIVRIDRVVHDAKTGELKWEETAWAMTSASPERADLAMNHTFRL